MRNGYALPRPGALARIKARGADPGSLRIGLQWDSEVTLPGADHSVGQAYCSAMPVAYSREPVDEWEDLARLVLRGAYEATLRAGILNRQRTGRNVVWLTRLGGGAFGYPAPWIDAAIEAALDAVPGAGLDLRIVRYG